MLFLSLYIYNFFKIDFFLDMSTILPLAFSTIVCRILYINKTKRILIVGMEKFILWLITSGIFLIFALSSFILLENPDNQTLPDIAIAFISIMLIFHMLMIYVIFIFSNVLFLKNAKDIKCSKCNYEIENRKLNKCNNCKSSLI